MLFGRSCADAPSLALFCALLYCIFFRAMGQTDGTHRTYLLCGPMSVPSQELVTQGAPQPRLLWCASLKGASVPAPLAFCSDHHRWVQTAGAGRCLYGSRGRLSRAVV